MNKKEILGTLLIMITIFGVGVACGNWFFRSVETKMVIDKKATLSAYATVLHEAYNFEISPTNMAIDKEDVEILDFSSFVKFLIANSYKLVHVSGDYELLSLFPIIPDRSAPCLWVSYEDVEYFWRIK